MLFKNYRQLLSNAEDPTLRADALKILEYALRSVDPADAVLRNVSIIENVLTVGVEEYPLHTYERVIVIGAGKASGRMAKALESILGDRISHGVVIVLEGTQQQYDLQKISLQGAYHPVPDEKNVESTRKMLTAINGLTERDLVFILISGGGSSLMTLPADGISLYDLQHVTEVLLKSGATINELNAVRKHLSKVKGGLLANQLYPAAGVTLILSDVINDPLDVIGSGPTVADTTTYQDALDVLSKYRLLESAPKSILERLKQGESALIPETTKAGDPILKNLNNLIIGNVKIACEAARRMAASLGYSAIVNSATLQGEASVKGRELVKAVLARKSYGDIPAALIYGGETTVHVSGRGSGGRNQELALSVVDLLHESGIVLVAMATDGIDGNSDSAGAIVDGRTYSRALGNGMKPTVYLENNDSCAFFKNLGDTLDTGPTGTNVNDLTIILIPSRSAKSGETDG